MAMINILQYPDPKLKRKGIKVKEVNDKIRKIIHDMFETHYNTENCAALAATQLDIPDAQHITVIDFSPEKNKPLCLINAKIIHREGEMYESEGCMSVSGGTYEKVRRSAKIRVQALNKNGEIIEFDAEGFMAKCIQHELDHLDGLLFIDRLSSLKRKRIDKKFEKLERWKRQKQ